MKRAAIQAGFWLDQQQTNARRAIFHQWQQLNASGCIENFRIAAGEAQGWREGWFFADSDAYKWLDAASRIWASWPDERLGGLMDELIALLGRAQMPDGYIFTYNQVHFPGTRWQNLQIEHELYCHGHLIEAGVSHHEATGRTDLLAIAQKAADRIVADFSGQGPTCTPGHEEIELALLRLYALTAHKDYLSLAKQFIEQRGRTPLFALSILRQNSRVGARGKQVKAGRSAYLAAHPDFKPFTLPPGNASKQQPNARLRWMLSALSGKYFQQHAPIRRQTTPVGHAVRYAYLQTAAAMLARLSPDESLLPALQQSWQHMVTRRMYITGGIGSQPGLEGFGNDYELDPQYAYAETCAALGSLFWNWEMTQLTHQACYSDLFEWQLYNAAAVGMGLDGTSYLYNNPLLCQGGVTRQAWYSVPCCPSNLSRTWADLGGYIYTSDEGQIIIHQYISSHIHLPLAGAEGQAHIHMQSGLPWEGSVRITIGGDAPGFQLLLRQPSWADAMTVRLNGSPLETRPAEMLPTLQDAWGYDPRSAQYRVLLHACQPGDVLEIELDLSIKLRRAHPRMRNHAGKVAITRGPLVYCLESQDNPGVDLFHVQVEPDSLTPVHDPLMLGGVCRLEGRSTQGQPLVFIPYYAWGNRGPGQMTVWVNL